MGPKTATLPKVAVKSPAASPAAKPTATKAGGGNAAAPTNKLPQIATKQTTTDVNSTPAEATVITTTTDVVPDATALPVADSVTETGTTSNDITPPPVTVVVPKTPKLPVSSKPNGNVVLIYEQYNEEFPIENGSTTHAAIDDVYCLSFVMEGCSIHLAIHDPVAKRELEIDKKKTFEDIYIVEEPAGTYHGLEAGSTYYVYVEQQADALARDQENMKKKAKGMEGAEKITKDEYGNVIDAKGRIKGESCSCLFGNPCVDDRLCEDWANRMAVATKNGWKGF